MALSHVKSNPVANMTGTVTVFNSAGITATVAATDLVRPVDWNSAHNQYMTISGNTLNASTASGTNIIYQGAGNISLFATSDTLIFSGSQSVQTQGSVSLQGSQGAIVFSNSNGITFGGNASTITASHNGITSQTVQTQGSVQVQGSTGAISFANGNGITFGGNASTVTASHNGLTTARASNDAVGLNTALTANGVAWTVNSSGLSLNIPAFLTTAAQSGHSHGNPTLALTNLSGTTASNSAGLTLSLSAAAPGGGGGPALSAAGGSGSTGTIVFSNSNGVSFGWNAGTITATVEPGAAAGIAAVAAGTQQGTSGTVTFVNSNGITFGMSGSSQITASHNGLTQQSTQPVAVSGQNGSYAFSTLSFSNANGISFGTSGGSAVTASHNALTTARASNDAIGLNSAFTAGPLAMTINSSGLSLNAASAAGTTSGFTGGASISGSMTHNTAGLAISLSHPAWITTAMQSNAATISNINISAGTTSTNASAFTFANSNGISFGLGTGASVGSITASHNGLTTAALSNHSHGNPTLALTNLSGTTASNSAGLTLSLSAAAPGGGGGAGLSAGTQSVSTGTVAFANSNGITFGMSNSNQITASYNSTQFAGTGTTFAGANISASMTLNSNGMNLSASVAAPGAAAEQNAINLLGANTAGNTTATGSTIGFSGINMTLSGTNASQIVMSVPATSSIVGAGGISLSSNGSTITISYTGAGGGGVTLSGFNPYPDMEKIAGQYGQGTLMFDPMRAPNFVMDRIAFPINCTNSSNSSGSHTLSFWVGVYSRNASTLSAVFTASGSTAVTHSGTAGSYSLYSGQRLFTIAASQTLTEGDYWLGFVSRTASGGANGSYSHFVESNIASNFVGHFGSSNNTTMQLTLGQGLYTATTSGMPSSVAFSQIRGSDSAARRAAFIMFANSTV